MLSTKFGETKCYRVLDVCPDIFPFVNQAYGTASNLFYGTTLISSECGCQQGDPLGSFLFSLSIHSIVDSINLPLNIWYLDDATIGGPPEDVAEALKQIIIDAEEVGLSPNFKKCEMKLWNTEQTEYKSLFQELAPGIEEIHDEDATLLGSALSEEAISSILNQ